MPTRVVEVILLFSPTRRRRDHSRSAEAISRASSSVSSSHRPTRAGESQPLLPLPPHPPPPLHLPPLITLITLSRPPAPFSLSPLYPLHCFRTRVRQSHPPFSTPSSSPISHLHYPPLFLTPRRPDSRPFALSRKKLVISEDEVVDKTTYTNNAEVPLLSHPFTSSPPSLPPTFKLTSRTSDTPPCLN